MEEKEKRLECISFTLRSDEKIRSYAPLWWQANIIADIYQQFNIKKATVPFILQANILRYIKASADDRHKNGDKRTLRCFIASVHERENVKRQVMSAFNEIDKCFNLISKYKHQLFTKRALELLDKIYVAISNINELAKACILPYC